uniref:Alphavirus-like MT domain-containing protein n=1 Tax=Strongyloides stercoralis TaxID=6248 RepID=A0AAF5DLI4_STRER
MRSVMYSETVFQSAWANHVVSVVVDRLSFNRCLPLGTLKQVLFSQNLKINSCGPHAFSRCCRKLALKFMFHKFGFNRQKLECLPPDEYDVFIKDIGANPIAHIRVRNLAVYCFCPILDQKEVHRLYNLESFINGFSFSSSKVCNYVQQIKVRNSTYICSSKSQYCNVTAFIYTQAGYEHLFNTYTSLVSCFNLYSPLSHYYALATSHLKDISDIEFESKHMRRARLVVLRKLFYNFYSYAMTIPEAKFTVRTLLTAVFSFNSRELVSGVPVSAYFSIEPEELSQVVYAIHLLKIKTEEDVLCNIDSVWQKLVSSKLVSILKSLFISQFIKCSQFDVTPEDKRM